MSEVLWSTLTVFMFLSGFRPPLQLVRFSLTLSLSSPLLSLSFVEDVFSVITRRMQSLGRKQGIYFMVPETLSYGSL